MGTSGRQILSSFFFSWHVRAAFFLFPLFFENGHVRAPNSLFFLSFSSLFLENGLALEKGPERGLLIASYDADLRALDPAASVAILTVQLRVLRVRSSYIPPQWRWFAYRAVRTIW